MATFPLVAVFILLEHDQVGWELGLTSFSCCRSSSFFLFTQLCLRFTKIDLNPTLFPAHCLSFASLVFFR
jgi:hypothetical protein